MTPEEKLAEQARRLDRVGNLPFAGPQSFMRFPYRRELEGVALTVMGAPLDFTTCHRPGCRFGPRALREMSNFVLTELADLDRFQGYEVADFGDSWFAPGDLDHALSKIQQDAEQVLTSGSRLLTLGGEHLVSLPLLRAHQQKYGPLALLQFDSHTDLYDVWPRPYHGSVMALALEEGLFDPTCSLQVGIRSTPPPSAAPARVPMLDADWVLENGPSATARAILEKIGERPCYLSFDIDFLDPVYAPATGTPVVGGPSSWQTKKILHSLKPLQLVGADLVELSPPYDNPGQTTALTAASIAYWLLELMLP